MIRALEKGLTLRDFEDLTLGMLLDYIITYNNEHFSDDENDTLGKTSGTRMATQADFDRF